MNSAVQEAARNKRQADGGGGGGRIEECPGPEPQANDDRCTGVSSHTPGHPWIPPSPVLSCYLCIKPPIRPVYMLLD